MNLLITLSYNINCDPSEFCNEAKGLIALRIIRVSKQSVVSYATGVYLYGLRVVWLGGVGGCSTWTWMSSCRRMACPARVWAARTSVARRSVAARGLRSACPRRSQSGSAPPRPPIVWVQTPSTRRSRLPIPVSYTKHSWLWHYFHGY